MAGHKVSSIGVFVEGLGDGLFFVGVDVRKRSYSVCLLRPDGVERHWRMPADPGVMTARLSSLPIRIGTVCHEAEPPGIDKWSVAAMAQLRAMKLMAGVQDTLDSLLQEMDFLAGQQRAVDLRLRDLAGEQDEARRIAAMRSILGVGPVVATTFAGEARLRPIQRQ